MDIAAGEAEVKANPDSIVEERKDGATQSVAQIQLLLTLLSKLGMALITLAAKSHSVKPAKAKRRETADGPTLGGTSIEARGPNVVTLHARKRQVSNWLASNTSAEDGKEIQGGAILKEYRRATNRDIESAELRAILERLLPAGSVIGRNSGYVVTGRKLKTAAERNGGRRAAI